MVHERADVSPNALRVSRSPRTAFVVMPLVEPALERGGVHGGRPAGCWANRRVVHADDFRLDLHQQFGEGLSRRPAFLDFKRLKALIGL